MVTHAQHHAAEVGIAGAHERNIRIAQHGRYGWTLFYEHHVPTGDEALAEERSVPRQLRAAGSVVL